MADTLIIGHSGKLGAELHRQLNARGCDVASLDREDCDLRSADAVREAIVAREPDRVFNAAAYNDVDGAESDEHAAFDVNAMGPARVAAACREVGATLVQFSTDYVFGDGHDTPIDESAEPAPLSTYGRSKLVGERLVRQNRPGNFVIRTTGLYGRRRSNFIKSMIRHALAGTTLQVVDDETLSPTWVRPLADRAIAISETGVYGTYHAVSQGGCSWYDFTAEIFETLELEADLSPTAADAWNAEADRPGYSVLDNRMLRLVGVDPMPDWRESLRAFLAEHGSELIDELDGGK
ncbi:MAG: dTDP-4-dehydrorhamnose reductase [Bradymonadaceae bacterium]